MLAHSLTHARTHSHRHPLGKAPASWWWSDGKIAECRGKNALAFFFLRFSESMLRPQSFPLFPFVFCSFSAAPQTFNPQIIKKKKLSNFFHRKNNKFENSTENA